MTEIDATGALVLEQLVKRQSAAGVSVALAGITPKGRHGTALIAYGTFLAPETRRWFADADRAIEWAERRLFRESERGPRREIPLERLALMTGFDAAELEALRHLLKRQELDADDVLFREGEPGNRLYVLARGAAQPRPSPLGPAAPNDRRAARAGRRLRIAPPAAAACATAGARAPASPGTARPAESR